MFFSRSSNAVKEPKRIAIVGAGAAGMAAAYALSRQPDRFAVTVFDKEDHPGGMATSIEIDKEMYGAGYVNDVCITSHTRRVL
jgi:protoporphyrinogen oxidase